MILLRLKLQPHTAELGGQTALLCVQPVQQTGHRLARFFGAVWLIDWLAKPPLCERCLMGKDTQSSWLPTSWWGEPTMALSLLLCLIAHGFLPSPRSSSHAVVIVPPYTTQSHFLPLHCITSFLSAGCIITDCRLYLTASCFSTFLNSHIAVRVISFDVLRETAI